MKKRPGRGIELAEIETPRISSDQLLIRVKACGICGSDVHVYEWVPSYRWLTELLPIVPGHEFAGEIVEKGQDCTEVNLGQRITCVPFVPCGTCEFCQKGRPMICESIFGGDGIIGLHRDGALAEFVAVPKASAFPLPENVSFELGALTEPLAVAAHAVERSSLEIGSKALVFGPGPIGLAILLLVKTYGTAEIGAVGRGDDEFRLRLAERLGTDSVYSFEELEHQETEYSGRYDVIFETSGDPRAISLGTRLCKSGGKIVAVGIHPEKASVDVTDIVRNEKVIVGSYSFSPRTFARILDLMGSGLLDPSTLITHRFGLEDVVEAFETAASRRCGKVTIKP